MKWQAWRRRLTNIATSAFDLDGRMGLLDFYIFFFAIGFLFMALRLLILFFIPATLDPSKNFLLNDPGLIIMMPGMALLFIAMTRRLHDRNWSGWILLPGAIWVPFLWLLALTDEHSRPDRDWLPLFEIHFVITAILVLPTIQAMYIPGTRGPNRYGNDPRDTY